MRQLNSFDIGLTRFNGRSIQPARGWPLAAARLYVLLDGRSDRDDFQRLALGLIEAGVDASSFATSGWPTVNSSTVPGGCGG